MRPPTWSRRVEDLARRRECPSLIPCPVHQDPIGSGSDRRAAMRVACNLDAGRRRRRRRYHRLSASGRRILPTKGQPHPLAGAVSCRRPRTVVLAAAWLMISVQFTGGGLARDQEPPTNVSPSGEAAREATAWRAPPGARACDGRTHPPPRLASQPKARPGGRVDAATHGSWLSGRARLGPSDTWSRSSCRGRNHPSVRNRSSRVCIRRDTRSASPDTRRAVLPSPWAGS